MNTDGKLNQRLRDLYDDPREYSHGQISEASGMALDRINALAAKLAEVEDRLERYGYIILNLRHYLAEERARTDEANPLDDPRVVEIRQKAQAVIDRWDSPLWKDLPHTGESIDELRAALSALEGRT